MSLNDAPAPASTGADVPSARPLSPPDAAPVDDRAPGDPASPFAPVEAEVRPGSLRERVLRPQTFISFGVAAVILVFVVLRLQIDPAAVWAEARQANLLIYAGAFVAWYSTFPLRAIRWRMMLGRAGVDAAHGYTLPRLPGLVEILLLSWFVNCVVPAKLGDAYRSYLLKQDTGAPFSTGLGTILAERLIDLVVLFVMMTGALLLFFSGHFPDAAQQALALGLALIVLAAVALGVMWFSRQWIETRLPERFAAQWQRLHKAVFASLRRPEWFIAISIVIWLMEGLRFWLVAVSLHAILPLPTALVIALMGSLLTTIPFTPAGLGVVELGTTAVLTQVIGMNANQAGSIVLLDRVIGYWSVILIGISVLLWRTRREHKAGL